MKRIILIVMVMVVVTVYAEDKYALLIANSDYKKFGSLVGPVKEARELRIALTSLGFKVDLLENGTREQMLDQLDNIKVKLNGKAGVILFHYGGHGVQAQSTNYLIPVDAEIQNEKKLATRAIDINEVMSSLDECGAEANIIILDACRNNPLPFSTDRSTTRGLTVMGYKPKNSIIIYSAEAGTIAQDGIFTPAFTKLITQKNRSLTQILMQLRREVSIKTNGSQIPGEYNQLFYDIFLAGTSNDNQQEIKAVQANYKIPREGLLGEWLFSGNAEDTGPYMNHGIVNNATISPDRNGNINSCYYFDGSSYIEIPRNSILEPLDKITISVWANIQNMNNNYIRVLSKFINQGGSFGSYQIITGPMQPNPGDISGTIITTNRYAWNNIEKKTPINDWVHIIFSYDGNEMKTYYNTIEVGKQLVGGNILYDSTSGSLLIGKDGYYTTAFFNGYIDDLRIYNRILSNSEIMDLYLEK